MNYIEKYKKALSRARECMKDGGISQNTIDYLCDIFPELKESKDKRIRKAIIALIKFGLEDGSAIAPGYNITKEEAITWLETQGEQKSVDKAKPKESEDEKIRKELINVINEFYDCYLAITKKNRDKYIAWLEKQGDKVEPKFKVGDWA